VRKDRKTEAADNRQTPTTRNSKLETQEKKTTNNNNPILRKAKRGKKTSSSSIILASVTSLSFSQKSR